MDKNLEQQLAELLNHLYILSIHTQLSHWLIRGPHFPSWHELFGEHYEGYLEMIDELAERTIMHKGSIGKSINELISINKDLIIDSSTPEKTIDHLMKLLNETMQTSIHATITATNLNEFVIADMITGMTSKLEKVNWYYKSMRS